MSACFSRMKGPICPCSGSGNVNSKESVCRTSSAHERFIHHPVDVESARWRSTAARWLCTAPFSTAAAAEPMSADRVTIAASLPPSSRNAGMNLDAQAPAMSRPVATLPVKHSASTLLMTAWPTSAGAGDVGEHLGQLRHGLDRGHHRVDEPGGDLARLDEHRAARRSGRGWRRSTTAGTGGSTG